MRKLSLILIMGGFLTTNTLSAFSKDMKIGFVDIFKVFNEYKKTVDYEAVLDGKKSEKEKVLEDKKDTVKKIQDKVGTLKGKAEEKEKEKLIEAAREFQDLERQFFLDLKKERDEKMQEILEDIDKVIQQYAKDNKFDLIINQGALLFGGKAMDLTDTILKLMNKRYKK